MREIKFRVWSGNMWLDGGDANIHPINPHSIDIELIASYPHSKHVMCQYTGLKDKNGKEIYEGDIVRWNSWRLGARSITGEEFKLYNNDVYWDEKDGAWRIRTSLFPVGIYSQIEVIGNIYENPELLK